MTSPVLPRLNALMEQYGITIRHGYPDHWDMYSFLDKQGMMEYERTIRRDLGNDYVEIPWNKERITITIAPSNKGKHRVFVTCDCGVLVPYGRLHQHKCKKGQ